MPQVFSPNEVKTTKPPKAEKAPSTAVRENRPAQAPENNIGSAFDAAFNRVGGDRGGDEEIVARLRVLADERGHQLGLLEIQKEVGCTALEAKRYRQLCKKS